MRKKIILGIVLLIVGFSAIYGVRLLLLGGAPPATTTINPTNGQVSNALSSPSNTKQAVSASLSVGKDFTIKQTKYFYGKDWVVVYVEPVDENAADPAYIIMHRQGTQYQTVLGPGSDFPSDVVSSKGVPSDVVDYLRSLGLISSGI